MKLSLKSIIFLNFEIVNNVAKVIEKILSTICVGYMLSFEGPKMHF